MNTDSGENENQVQSVENTITVPPKLNSVTVNGVREAPPPYTPHADPQQTSQPVINQTIIMQQQLKNVPTMYNCHICHEQVLTKVKYENTLKTHVLAGFIFGLTLSCLMCCLGGLPYVLKVFKKTVHYCPNCDEILGTYSKM